MEVLLVIDLQVSLRILLVLQSIQTHIQVLSWPVNGVSVGTSRFNHFSDS
jgi:hypothetical protein